MRMWLVDPTKMCRKHLLGEHVEMHMFVGTLNKGKNIHGFLRNKLVDTDVIKERHDILALEMERRGYNHKSPLEQPELEKHFKTVNVAENEIDLAGRCSDCAALLNLGEAS